jgi:hypothetical protein
LRGRNDGEQGYGRKGGEETTEVFHGGKAITGQIRLSCGTSCRFEFPPARVLRRVPYTEEWFAEGLQGISSGKV